MINDFDKKLQGRDCPEIVRRQRKVSPRKYCHAIKLTNERPIYTVIDQF